MNRVKLKFPSTGTLLVKYMFLMSSTGSGCMINHFHFCRSNLKQANSSGEQQTINNYYKSIFNDKKQIPKDIKRAITTSCVEFVAEDGRAFHLLQGSGFVRLAKQLFDSGQRLSSSTNISIRDLLPTSSTISRNIDKMYDFYKQQLIKFFKSMDSYCVIVDFWCEPFTGLSYCGISHSHIDPEFQSYMFSIGCFPYEMENKRAPTIRTFVNDTLKDFGLVLDQEKFVVTDNEPTMLCTFNTDCKRIGCSDHYINKQFQHTFTTKTIDGKFVNCDLAQGLFNNVKTLVSNIRRIHKQQNLSKKLVLYSDTRFSGAYEMLNVFSSIFDELVQILDSKLSTIYSNIEKDILFDVCRFLFPFDTVLRALSDDKRPTIHRVLPFKQYLINKCVIDENDDEAIKQVKSFLGKRLDEKWEITDQHLIAAVLHPNNKHLHKTPQFKDRALFLLKQEMYKRYNHSLSTSSSSVPVSSITSSTSSISCSSSTSSILCSSSTSSVSCSSSTSSILCSSSTPFSSLTSITKSVRLDARDILLREVFDKPPSPSAPERNDADKEFENYLASTLVMEGDENDDILAFWRQHKQTFPLIASIARDILAIPASNTTVERQFSSCKNTVTDKRTKLGSEKMNKLIFLKKNMNILKEKFPVSFAEPSDSLNNKEADFFDNQSDNECFVDIESEEVEEIF
ncbi:unnamed protein product [Rotaria sordida]|uniref:HAT C-terminal dimerisation domain-containing protein n=1 Tax=Rotaria sordida TaxID=392033 RepID=A0A815XYD2_9BILA|nr:unnamed protein product [Rotaria sordida]CAF1563087.1 unnamed protein product [Rotaria sordida]